MTENLHTKLIEKLVNKKFEFWKEEFVKKLKEELNEITKKKEFSSNDYDLALIYSFECEVREQINKIMGEFIKWKQQNKKI